MNPYRQNIEIVKGFFRRPIVLITAILGFLTAAADIAASVLGTDFISNLQLTVNDDAPTAVFYSYISLNVGAILLGAVLLAFFIASRSERSDLHGATMFYKVVAIVELVFSILLIFAALILGFLFFVIGLAATIHIPPAVFFVTLFLIIAAIALIAILVYCIAQLVFAVSIRRSTRSIYLRSGGAVFFGVINLLFALVYSLTFVDNLVSDIRTGLPAVGTFLPLVNIAFGICTAVLAFKYWGYINNVKNNYVQPAPPQQEFIPEPVEESNFDVPADEENPYARPAQSAPVMNTQVPPAAPVTDTPPAAPVAEAPVQSAPTANFCTNCGAKLAAGSRFCSDCGAPVQR